MTPNILIVDDDILFLSQMSEFLMREGFNIIGAQSAAEALKILSCTKIDLVISTASTTDEIQLAKQIKKRKRQTPVVILSTGLLPRDQLIAAGADKNLLRSISYRSLTTQIQLLLSGFNYL